MSLLTRFAAAVQAFRSPVNAATLPSVAATPFGTGSSGVTSNAAFSPRQLHQMKPYERRQAITTARFLRQQPRHLRRAQ